MISEMAIWSRLSGFPSFANGWLRGNVVTTHRKVKDLDEDNVRVLQEQYLLASGPHTVAQLERLPQLVTDVQKPVVSLDLSPSGRHTLVLRNGKEDTPFVELNSGGFSQRIDATAVHGKMLGDGWFSAISWAEGERFVAYTACSKKKGKLASLLDTEGDVEMRGTKFELLNSDWGEKYNDVGLTCINVLDTMTGKIVCVVDGAKDEAQLSVGQPVLNTVGDRTVLYYTAWTSSPKRLGMIYCYQRPCAIYSLDVTDLLSGDGGAGGEAGGATPTPTLVSTSCALARSPRISPDGARLVFVGRREPMATHNGCFSLFSVQLSELSSSPQLVLDLVAEPLDEGGFPGLFCDQLPRQCFAGANSVVFNSAWGSRESACVVDLATGVVTRLTGQLAPVFAGGTADGWNDARDASCSVLDVDAASQRVLFSASSPTVPPRIGVWDLAASKLLGWSGADTLPSMTASRSPPGEAPGTELVQELAGMRWRVLQHRAASSGIGKRFESILLLSAAAGAGPLTVVPHGGPHSCMTTSFLASSVFLAMQTAGAVLLVNYRGSTGFGQASIDSLPGNIGKNDVADMIQAADDAVAAFPSLLDGERMSVVGGSHGGFLTGHLIGQHPDKFKAAAMRNPVTNIPAMLGVTDINDWCVVEAGHEYDFSAYKPVTAQVLASMLASSPVAHIDAVKTPTLIALGAKDRRVPSSQGLDFFHMLKARGVPAKLLVFPEDTHAIDNPASEAEHWVAIAKWFKEHGSVGGDS